MSHSPLERVQQDLKVIQSALQSDFPYDRGSIALSAVAGLCGVPLALRAVPGWDRPMTGVLLALIAGLLIAWGGWLRRARAERGIRPRRWCWGRQETMSSAIAIVGLVVYAMFTRWSTATQAWNFAAWRDRLAGPALFAFGVGMVVVGVSRSERRGYLGWALALTALGLGMPFIPSRPAFWVVSGVATVLGGLVSTALLWWQFRQCEGVYVGN